MADKLPVLADTRQQRDIEKGIIGNDGFFRWPADRRKNPKKVSNLGLGYPDVGKGTDLADGWIVSSVWDSPAKRMYVCECR